MENLRSLTNVVASQATSTDYNTGSNDIIAFVNDNPMQEYVVKLDAQLAGNGSWRTSTSWCSECNEYEQLHSDS